MPPIVIALLSGCWNWIVQALSNKTVRAAVAFAVVCAVLCFLAYQRGSSDREQAYLKQEHAQVILALNEYKAEVAKQRAEDIARQDRDLALVADVRKEANRLRSFTNDLTGQINGLSEASSGIRLSLDAVRLLNAAKAGEGAGGTVPGSPGGPAGPGSAPSGVGLTDLIRDGVVTAEQYNLMRSQCNALIDWSKRELIDANKKRLGQR